jgi:phospholipid/cholesterol/gamma-HCH transport system permease protein
MKKFFENIYEMTSFSLRFFKELPLPPYEAQEFVKHVENFGLRSFPLVSVSES